MRVKTLARRVREVLPFLILMFVQLYCAVVFLLCFFYLEHIKRTAFVALANHYLADKVGILSHQHVLEAVDLNERHNNA